MNTIITETDGKYIVSLEGELDTAQAIEVEEAMKPLHDVSGIQSYWRLRLFER